MILFKTYSEIPEDFLIHHGIKKILTFNLSSYIEGYPNIYSFMNIVNEFNADTVPFDTVIFDSWYADIITTRNDLFISLMSIVLPAYNEPDTIVQILVNRSPLRDCITDNIAKLIQQRYGYNCYIVNTIEDLYYVRDDSVFTIPGLMNLNRDIERYAELVGPISGELTDESCME